MHEYKREKHIRLLQKLREVMIGSNGQNDPEYDDNKRWITSRIREVGELEKTKGLLRHEMVEANRLWRKYTPEAIWK
tara:strand:+ start:968 stop:1198 length:231 start_codon:yes stop_codon:yes gene_type:complete